MYKLLYFDYYVVRLNMIRFTSEDLSKFVFIRDLYNRTHETVRLRTACVEVNLQRMELLSFTAENREIT